MAANVSPVSEKRALSKPASLALVLTCLATSNLIVAAGSNEPEVLALTKPSDIQQASAMDKAIVRLSNKVMDCVRAKLAPDSQCYCLYTQELSDMRTTYEATMKAHPEWQNRVVSYTQEGKTFAVSFGGLSRQLENKCPQTR